MRRLTTALAATLLGLPAWAGSMPSLTPTHDVSGTYLATGQDGPKTIAVEYSKSANTLRLTPPDGAGYLLYDFAAHDAKMVLPQMQRYMDQPAIAAQANALQGHTTGDNVSIAKTGTETIAGHACTDYTATNKTKGTSSTLCVTADNVLLKLTSPNGNSITAQTISYKPIPPTDVTIPPTYQPFTIPQMPAGLAVPPGMPSP